jgi:hypothetical protein
MVFQTSTGEPVVIKPHQPVEKLESGRELRKHSKFEARRQGALLKTLIQGNMLWAEVRGFFQQLGRVLRNVSFVSKLSEKQPMYGLPLSTSISDEQNNWLF